MVLRGYLAATLHLKPTMHLSGLRVRGPLGRQSYYIYVFRCPLGLVPRGLQRGVVRPSGFTKGVIDGLAILGLRSY